MAMVPLAVIRATLAGPADNATAAVRPARPGAFDNENTPVVVTPGMDSPATPVRSYRKPCPRS